MTLTSLIAEIDALLPQTQCTKCGYAGCEPYAQAIAEGAADINQCAPGGATGIAELAALLDRPVKPLNPINGAERARHVAFIDETRCIGCTLCIQACPVDAIIGAPKQMHTVLTNLCSGCDLCVAPCPVDCISMIPAIGEDANWDRDRANAARARLHRRLARFERDKTERAARLGRPAIATVTTAETKQAFVRAALERARARRAAGASGGK